MAHIDEATLFLLLLLSTIHKGDSLSLFTFWCFSGWKIWTNMARFFLWMRHDNKVQPGVKFKQAEKKMSTIGSVFVVAYI